MDDEIEPVYRAVGARVQMIRELLGQTQDDVAKAVGMSRPNLVNLENGKHRMQMHHLEAIAKALATTPKNLMKGIWF